jgi:hypothetical protein
MDEKVRSRRRRIVFLNHAAVFEFGCMETSTQLSAFDWIGVAVVALLGTCLGWEISTAKDIVLTPTLAVVFPGFAIGAAVSKIVGHNIVEVVSGLSNGAVYGLLLHEWNRVASRISRRGLKL